MCSTEYFGCHGIHLNFKMMVKIVTAFLITVWVTGGINYWWNVYKILCVLHSFFMSGWILQSLVLGFWPGEFQFQLQLQFEFKFCECGSAFKYPCPLSFVPCTFSQLIYVSLVQFGTRRELNINVLNELFKSHSPSESTVKTANNSNGIVYSNSHTK